MPESRQQLRLTGCRSRPLLGYLKALGVLRTVTRQADAEGRGRWVGDVFELRSELDAGRIERFFLERYRPAPVVSPWNGGSGFFAGDNKEGFAAIEASGNPKLGPMREAIAAARAALQRLGLTEKPGDKNTKARLLGELRATLPDGALEWLDTAVVLPGGSPAYPALLGSGGNDGRFDFANNYARALALMLCQEGRSDGVERARAWLKGALWNDPAPLQRMSIGHLMRDSSPVMSPLGEVDGIGNPWDLVLALEGSLAFAAGVARRHGAAIDASLAAPFTVHATSAGYASALAGESGRAELWLPLWRNFAGLAELEAMTREGRAQVGRRAARTGLDFVRATAELGIARGIEAFERYAILERAGQSNIAVSAGRVEVRARPEASALRTLDSWLERVLRYGSGDCPAAHREAIRRLERAVFAFAQRGGPDAAGAVLTQLGRVERVLARSGARAARSGLVPLRHAPAQPWLMGADDGSPEFRIAVSLASLRDPWSLRHLPQLRDYLHGTSRDERGMPVYTQQIANHVLPNAAPIQRLAAIHARRHLDVERIGRAVGQGDDGGLALGWQRGLACDLALVQALLANALDGRRMMSLLEGLALLDFSEARAPHDRPLPAIPSPVLELLALAWWGTQIGIPIAARAGWASQLARGALRSVVADALLRLQMAEAPSLVTVEDLMITPEDGPRLAAALLLRPRKRDLRLIAQRLTSIQSEHVQGAPA